MHQWGNATKHSRKISKGYADLQKYFSGTIFFHFNNNQWIIEYTRHPFKMFLEKLHSNICQDIMSYVFQKCSWECELIEPSLENNLQQVLKTFKVFTFIVKIFFDSFHVPDSLLRKSFKIHKNILFPDYFSVIFRSDNWNHQHFQ